MTTPPPPPPPPQRTNPVFAIGAVLAFVAMLGLAAINGTIAHRDSAYMAGEFTGVFVAAGLVLLIVIGIALAMGKARTTAAKVQITFWTTGVMALAQFSVFLGRRELDRRGGLVVITDSERAGLVVDSTRVWHRQFGFSFPNPGGEFQLDSALQHSVDSLLTKGGGFLAGWALRSRASGAVVIVQVAKDTAVNEISFRAFARGASRTAVRPGSEVLLDSTTWSGSPEYRFAARTSIGTYVQFRCLPRTGGGHGVIACVMTVGRDLHDLDFVRDSLTFAAS